MRTYGGRPRFYATTRQLTGTGYVYHSYVYDRMTGRPIAACRHAHRHGRTAQDCAERMLRKVLREQPS